MKNEGPETSAALEKREYTLEQYLGNTIRDLRTGNNLTIADVSDRIGISRGMLSKIENGQTSTSLDTLQKISQVFGVTMSYLFRNYNAPTGGAQMIPSGKGMEVVRVGTSKGYTYQLLAYEQGSKKVFEPYLITMDNESQIFPTFEHPGTEFIYMLEGKIEYRHGNRTYVLGPGDSLTFPSNVPHGPERLMEVPIRFIDVMIHDSSAKNKKGGE